MTTSRPTTSQTVRDCRQLMDRHLSLDDFKCVLDLPEKPLDLKTEPGFLAIIPEKAQAEITYPDGGWRAWLTLLGVFIVQFCTFGYINAYGVYQDFYVRIYLNERTSSQISWIGSTQVFLILSMGLFTGVAFDKGYYYHMMLAGISLITISLLMLSLCQPQQFYAVFLCHGLGLGIGNGLTYVPSIGLVSHYFRRRRTLALGIASAGSSMGGLLHPILLNHLLHRSKLGFRHGVRVSAALNFILLVTAMTLMKPRLSPTGSKSILPKLRKFIRDPPYVALVIAAVFQLFGLFFPIFFLQLYAIKHNIDRRYAFFTVTILNGGNLLGRLIPNMIANRFGGVLNLSIFSTACCGILTFAMLGIRDFPGVVVFGLLYGFFSGAYISLTPPSLANISEDVSEVGSRLGICLGIAGFTALIGSPVAGALLSSNYLWYRPSIVAASSVLIGAASLVVARYLVMKREAKRQKGFHIQTCLELGGSGVELPSKIHLRS